MKTLLVAVNAKYIHSNLAVRCIKCYAEKRIDADISISEYTINNYINEILQDIYRQKPDVIGFSCYLWNIEYIRRLCVLLKKFCLI